MIFPLCSMVAHGAESGDLYLRFHRADSTLTQAEVRTLYLDYAHTDAYRQSLVPLPLDLGEAVKQRPLSLQVLYDVAIARKREGNEPEMQRLAEQLWMLGSMLHDFYTGDSDSPIPILYREDEHFYLHNWENIDAIVSEERSGRYDLIECTMPPDWTYTFHFQTFDP